MMRNDFETQDEINARTARAIAEREAEAAANPWPKHEPNPSPWPARIVITLIALPLAYLAITDIVPPISKEAYQYVFNRKPAAKQAGDYDLFLYPDANNLTIHRQRGPFKDAASARSVALDFMEENPNGDYEIATGLKRKLPGGIGVYERTFK